MAECRVEGCHAPRGKRKGMCAAHYQRQWRERQKERQLSRATSTPNTNEVEALAEIVVRTGMPVRVVALSNGFTVSGPLIAAARAAAERAGTSLQEIDELWEETGRKLRAEYSDLFNRPEGGHEGTIDQTVRPRSESSLGPGGRRASEKKENRK